MAVRWSSGRLRKGMLEVPVHLGLAGLDMGVGPERSGSSVRPRPDRAAGSWDDAAATEDVVAGIGRDPEQPGTEDAAAVGADGPIRVDEGVLGRVGSLVRVAEEAPRQAVAGALVVLHEPGEGRRSPVAARATISASSGSGCVRPAEARSGASVIASYNDGSLGRGGGIGRRVGLKHRWAQARVGSSPTPGTTSHSEPSLAQSTRCHGTNGRGGFDRPPLKMRPVTHMWAVEPDFLSVALLAATVLVAPDLPTTAARMSHCSRERTAARASCRRTTATPICGWSVEP